MPIEIVPKPLRKEPVWLNILFYISIGLLISAILSYFLLDYFQKTTSKTLEEIKESFLIFRTPEQQELERNILQYQKKIDDFALIFKQQRANSSFFPFLEEITHPQVVFSNFDLNGTSVRLSGEAENFVVLDQQLSIFRKNPNISDTNLSQVSLGNEGKVSFSFNFSISPKIFEFK